MSAFEAGLEQSESTTMELRAQSRRAQRQRPTIQKAEVGLVKKARAMQEAKIAMSWARQEGRSEAATSR